VQVRVGAVWHDVGSLVKLNFVANAASAADSWIVQPSSSSSAVADGVETLPVSVYVFDVYGNAVQSGSVTFTLPAGVSVGVVTGPNTVVVPVSSGVASVNVKATVAGTHEITASVGGDQIMAVKEAPGAADPIVASDGKALLRFVPGVPDPGSSVLTIPTAAGGVTKLADGVETHTAQVVVRDANNNLVKSGTVTFSYSFTDFAGVPHTGSSAAQTIDPVTGVASWSFSSTVAKVWTVTATLAGVSGNVDPVAGVMAGFHAGPVDPAATTASLRVGANAKADGVAFVAAWMTVQDAFGNPIPGEYCGFALTDTTDPGAAKFDNAVTGSFTKANVGPTGSDGRCTVEIRSVYEGAFPVKGVYATVETPGPLPTAIFNNVPPDPARSFWSVAARTGNSTTPATANDTDSYIVSVSLRDAANAIVNNASVDVYYRLTPGGVEQMRTVITGAAGNPAGTATYAIHTTTAGVYDVYVKIGSDPVATTAGGTVFTQSVEFVPGVPNGVESFLTSAQGNAKANGVEELSVTATVKDVHGNVIKNAPVVFLLPADVTSGVTTGPGTVSVNTNAAGVATLPLTSVKPGTYSVTATAAGTTITTGSPATAVFVNDDLSLTSSTLVLVSSGLKTVSVESHTVRATLLDAQGNVFTAARSIAFYVKAPGAASFAPTPVATLNTVNGVVDYTFSETLAGTWQVRAEVASGSPTGKIGIGADGTIVDAGFKAGAPDPVQTATSWTGSTGKVLNNNTATHYVQVTVQDQFGNPVSGASIDFALDATKAAHFTTVTGSGDLGKTRTVTSGTDGVITLYLASTADETTSITATLASVSVVKPSGPSTFQFGPGAPDATTSTFTLTPAGTRIADGVESFEGTVTVRDAASVVVGSSQVTFQVPVGVSIVEAGPYMTDATGSVTVHFTSTTAGDYTLNALVGSDKVPAVDQVVKFVAGPIDWTRSSLTVTANGAVANGVATNGVRATLVDQNGNPVTDGFVNFTLPTGVTATGSVSGLATDSNGQQEIQVVSETAATYSVTATASKGTPAGPSAILTGSPANVTFIPGPVVAGSSVLSVVETGPKTADGVAYYTVNIELKDAKGNTVTTAGIPVHYSFSLAGQSSVEVDAVTAATGVASYQYATTHAGTWSVAGTYSGSSVTGSPQPLLFVAGPVSTSASTFDVTGGQVQADGVASHRAWVVATDKDGNPVSGVTVTFSIATGATSVPGPVLGTTAGTPGTVTDTSVTTGIDGVAEVFITSFEPGTFSVNAKIGTTPVTGNAVTPLNRDAQFSSGDPDPGASSRSVTPDTDANATLAVTANGSDSFTITTTILSAFGTKVENATVRITGLDAAVTLAEGAGTTGGLLTGLPTSANYGTFTWHASSTTAGSYTAQVQVRVGAVWHDVGAPVVLNFKSDAPVLECETGVLTCTSYTVTPVTQAVGGDVNVNVLVTDKYGNPSIGTRVTLETTPGGVFTITSGVDADGYAITDASGHVSATFTDTVARIDDVRAKIGGPGSTQYVTTEDTMSLPAADRVTTIGVEFLAGPPTVGPFICEQGKTGTSFNFDPLMGNYTGIDVSVGTVKVTDAFCNPIQGANVTFTTTGGTFTPASGSVFTTAAGTVTIDLTDDVARTDTVSAVVNGLPIAVTGTEVAGVTPVTSQNVEFRDPIMPDTQAPIVDPSNGSEITGSAEPGSTIEVVDENGQPVPGCETVLVGADGRFACSPTPPLKDGDKVSVTATAPGSNPSAPVDITIGAIGIMLSPAKAYRGDTIIMRGFNFLPGESVSVSCNSTLVQLGTFTAGQNGQVIVPNWVVPTDFETGQHVCTFTGVKSGPVSAPLQILEPIIVATGGSVNTPTTPATMNNPGNITSLPPKRRLG
jgi:adhesin/invasin